MKTSHPIRHRVANTGRALACGLTLIGTLNAPRMACAQTPQSALNLDAKVVLPAQFSVAQFYDALARATGARIVAPIPNSKRLAEMNLALGGRELSAKEIARQFNDIAEIGLSTSTGGGNLVTARIPDETLYPTPAVDKTNQPFLDLLLSLSREQIDKMYLNGTLTPDDLTAPQRSLYLTARRTGSGNFPVTRDDKPLSDEQILAQPLRFRFALQATMNFVDDEALPTVPLFDYGTGLVWDALVPMDTKTPRFAADNQVATAVGAAQLAVNKKAAPLEWTQTQTTPLGKSLDIIEAATGQKLTFDARFEPKRLRARPVVISAGHYSPDELLEALAASVGLQCQWGNNSAVLELRAPQKPISQLPLQVETAQQKLRRLSPVWTTAWPFFSSRFSKKYARLEELTNAESFFIRSRLLNENTEGYDKIDLSKGRVRFSDTLYFIGRSGGPNTPFITSSIQIY